MWQNWTVLHAGLPWAGLQLHGGDKPATVWFLVDENTTAHVGETMMLTDDEIKTMWSHVPYIDEPQGGVNFARAIIAAYQAELRQGVELPEGLPLVISGAIFDFAGYLTTRPKVIEVGSAANASPMVELIKEWADLRGLSLDDAAVQSWQEWLPTGAAPAAQPATWTDDGGWTFTIEKPIKE